MRTGAAIAYGRRAAAAATRAAGKIGGMAKAMPSHTGAGHMPDNEIGGCARKALVSNGMDR
ncbi:hypothetical protein EFR84_18225 [Rhizobium chutanense]|uniref:Uncharacterized protein n=1 Tax=Rhizobium chutanense TaxID=2035448 RepID=A0A432NWN2_9HYPH|nr:hypothetical protein EFR84_18225 [Rhizobium chutanense]